MDEITRFRWQLIANETIDRAFSEAGIDELLAEVAAAGDGSNSQPHHATGLGELPH